MRRAFLYARSGRGASDYMCYSRWWQAAKKQVLLSPESK